MSNTTLDGIERYLDALDAGLATIDADALDLAPPPLTDAVGAEDADRLRALYARLTALKEQVEGQRVRLAGELAGMRRRPGHLARRSPGWFDQTV